MKKLGRPKTRQAYYQLRVNETLLEDKNLTPETREILFKLASLRLARLNQLSIDFYGQLEQARKEVVLIGVNRIQKRREMDQWILFHNDVNLGKIVKIYRTNKKEDSEISMDLVPENLVTQENLNQAASLN